MAAAYRPPGGALVRRTRDYVLRMPKDTTVVAACEQVRCDNWRFGWDTILDERTVPGRDAAAWIRSGRSGRSYRELAGGGEVTVFRFSPHQRCFGEHRTRPARWLVREGRALTEHADMHDWIGDLEDHAVRLEEQARRG
jgi:hypothetical protein